MVGLGKRVSSWFGKPPAGRSIPSSASTAALSIPPVPQIPSSRSVPSLLDPSAQPSKNAVTPGMAPVHGRISSKAPGSSAKDKQKSKSNNRAKAEDAPAPTKLKQKLSKTALKKANSHPPSSSVPQQQQPELQQPQVHAEKEEPVQSHPSPDSPAVPSTLADSPTLTSEELEAVLAAASPIAPSAALSEKLPEAQDQAPTVPPQSVPALGSSPLNLNLPNLSPFPSLAIPDFSPNASTITSPVSNNLSLPASQNASQASSPAPPTRPPDSRPPSREKDQAPQLGGLMLSSAPAMPTSPPPPPPRSDELVPRIEAHAAPASSGGDDLCPLPSSTSFPSLPYSNIHNSRSMNSLPDLYSSHGCRPGDRTNPSSRRNSHIRAGNRISSLTLQVPGMMSSANSDAGSVRSARIKSSRRSWIGSVLGRSKDKDIPEMPALPDCWELEPENIEFPVVETPKKLSKQHSTTALNGLPYDIDRLLDGQLAAELWVNGGDTDVHLFPGARAVFRVPCHIFAHSRVLMENCMVGKGDDRSAPKALLIPLGSLDDDASSSVRQRVLAVRNLFAFLLGKTLVASTECPTAMSVLAAVTDLLSALEFGDLGGTFGPVVTAAFDRTVAELKLADVRGSVRRIIDALVLAERFKSPSLYGEAFAHASGMNSKVMKDPGLAAVSPATRTLLERSSFDLESKERAFVEKLRDCQFRGLFAGAMTGKSAAGKVVSYPSWQSAFGEMRSFVLDFFKNRYGSWTPSRRPGLPAITRLQARHIYSDFAALYDFLVDRTRPTTRKEGDVTEGIDASTGSANDRIVMAIRRVLAEYDESAPPVLPAMPYDVPRLPTLPEPTTGTKSATSRLALLRARPAERRKLQRASLPGVLAASHNTDVIAAAPQGSILHAFIRFEARVCGGKSVSEIIQVRCGIWLFVYAVLQSLPPVVVDAPLVKHSAGVEYFLCQPAPIVNPANPDVASFSGLDTTGSIDTVMQRSHAWARGREWSGQTSTDDAHPAALASPAELPEVQGGGTETSSLSDPSSSVGAPGARFFIASSEAGSLSSGISPIQSPEPTMQGGVLEGDRDTDKFDKADLTGQATRSNSDRSGSGSSFAVPSVDQIYGADRPVRGSSLTDHSRAHTPRQDESGGYSQQQQPLPIPAYLQHQFPAHPTYSPPSSPHHRTSLSSSSAGGSPKQPQSRYPSNSAQTQVPSLQSDLPTPPGASLNISSYASMSMPHLPGAQPITPAMTPASSMTGISKFSQRTSSRVGSVGPRLPNRQVSMTFDEILADSTGKMVFGADDKAAKGSSDGDKPKADKIENGTNLSSKRRSWWIGGH